MTNISRSQFLQMAGVFTTRWTFFGELDEPKPDNVPIKAVVFDGFPIFDPRPIFKKVAGLLPENGLRLAEAWQVRQFSYQWLRVLGSRYKRFLDVSRDALITASEQFGVRLSASDIDGIMSGYQTIGVWDDVIPVLKKLKTMRLSLGFLSNMTKDVVQGGIQNAGIEDSFEFILSTDTIRTFKPDSRAYQLAIDALGLKKEEILFVAFAGWDMAGAKWFGYPTYWVNRMNAPMDTLDAIPNGKSENMIELPSFVEAYNS